MECKITENSNTHTHTYQRCQVLRWLWILDKNSPGTLARQQQTDKKMKGWMCGKWKDVRPDEREEVKSKWHFFNISFFGCGGGGAGFKLPVTLYPWLAWLTLLIYNGWWHFMGELVHIWRPREDKRGRRTKMKGWNQQHANKYERACVNIRRLSLALRVFRKASTCKTFKSKGSCWWCELYLNCGDKNP